MVIDKEYCQVEFRNKYKIPIFLEESFSFGVLGRTGRGAAEHFNIPVRSLLNHFPVALIKYIYFLTA